MNLSAEVTVLEEIGEIRGRGEAMRPCSIREGKGIEIEPKGQAEAGEVAQLKKEKLNESVGRGERSGKEQEQNRWS
ncbi:hypothetical protein SDJN03_19616, partial [Cucurbita argyrosperma subsp. sororia]